MNFVSAVKSCFRQYVGFSGKASRSEFWWFYLFTTLVMVVLCTMAAYDMFNKTTGGIVILMLFLPSWAVSVRRLHDVGRSGWWLLLSLTGIGNLVLLYWYVKPGKE